MRLNACPLERSLEYKNKHSASRYSTFCELAGEDPADLEAEQANAWLRARRLPQLPPVDGISHSGPPSAVYFFFSAVVFLFQASRTGPPSAAAPRRRAARCT